MFARNVSLRLKPNTLNEFTMALEKDVLPILRKQPGFCDEITLAYEEGTDVTAISLWDSMEHAEAYSTTAYPEVLMRLEKVLDGSPRVRVSTVINSTVHTIAAGIAA
jgi:heme-degrading monooxygenase HmoA